MKKRELIDWVESIDTPVVFTNELKYSIIEQIEDLELEDENNT